MSLQRIHHGDTEYQTRWPLHAFRVWRNIEIDIHDNRNRIRDDVVCPHCQNRGIVALDAHPHTIAACPMCAVGRVQNVAWRMPLRYDKSGKPIFGEMQPVSDWCWRPSDDLHQYSWNHGASIDDTDTCNTCHIKPTRPGATCRTCINMKELTS